MTGKELGEWVLSCLEGTFEDDPSFTEWCNPESVAEQLCDMVKQHSCGVTSEEMKTLNSVITETVKKWLQQKKEVAVITVP